MKINIQSRGLTEGVRYIQPVKEVSLVNDVEKDMVFTLEALQKEIQEGSHPRQTRKTKQILRGVMAVLVASAQVAPKALAAGTDIASQTITPSMVLKWGSSLALLGVSASVSLSMIMLIVASFYKMMRKGEKADQWSSDILKGLVQSLVAVPLVSILFYLAQIVFKNLPSLGSL
ncbi:hypothetical protein CPT_Moonbeam185 [Bacillus phage Moonbeam]|uniref:Uncharacterized protein n=1 Tax=Bacillus phage Moonbeam TaxID=1540091 RepID=A0A0A0RVA3_9CAUD|nr:hypothetical protein CPT_Moonbeam185 [Bacillus phage Moonbeam]AIW03583.1 hypothetical protein CPT_Moonbeam185 [Bacillus phage Moonbeam]